MFEKPGFNPEASETDDYYHEFSQEEESNVPEFKGSAGEIFKHADMYRLPGDEPLARKDILRYARTNEQFDHEVLGRIKRDPSFLPHVPIEMLRTLSEEDQRVILLAKFKSTNLLERVEGILTASALPENLQNNLRKNIEQAVLNTFDKNVEPDLVRVLGTVISRMSESSQKKLQLKLEKPVRAAFKRGWKDQERNFINVIPYISDAAQREIVKETLAEKKFYSIADVCRSLQTASSKSEGIRLMQQDLPEVISAEMNTHSTDVPQAVELIKYTANPEQRQFFKKGLLDSDSGVRLTVAREILRTSGDVSKQLTGEAVEVLYSIVREPYSRRTLEAIKTVLDLDGIYREKFFPLVPKIVSDALKNAHSLYDYKTLAQIIPFALRQDQDKLWPLLVTDAEDMLDRIYDSGQKRALAATMSLIPNQWRLSLEEKFVGLVSTRREDPFVSKNDNQLLANFPMEMQGAVIRDLIRDKKIDAENLQSIATKTPLYENQPKIFFRRPFAKDGSGTTLLNNVPEKPEITLKEKVIIRHIEAGPYTAWRKAYESADFWRSKGFDYVPIEPIVAVRLPRDASRVDVITRVVRGPSVAVWEKGPAFFQNHIQKQMHILIEALGELGVDHGHLHSSNFVTVFPRSPNGEVLVDQPPRVYIIDFDQSISSSK